LGGVEAAKELKLGSRGQARAFSGLREAKFYAFTKIQPGLSGLSQSPTHF